MTSFFKYYILIFLTVFSISKAEIPIIIVHKGYQEYVDLCLKQIYRKNKEVYFVGDTNSVPEGIKFFDIKNYSQGLDSFKSIYKHYSHNSYAYELFCIQRWIVVKNLMCKEEIDRAFVCDSDVMLFCDISKENDFFKDVDLSLIEAHSVGLSNINGSLNSGGHGFWSLKSINKFYDFIFDFYTEGNSRLLYWYDKWLNKPKNQAKHSICDMTLFTIFVQEYLRNTGLKFKSIQTIYNDSCFESCLANSDGFRMVKSYRNMKDIKWVGDSPFAYHIRLKKWIKLNNIHLQGSFKGLATNFYNKL